MADSPSYVSAPLVDETIKATDYLCSRCCYMIAPWKDGWLVKGPGWLNAQYVNSEIVIAEAKYRGWLPPVQEGEGR